MGIAIAGTTAMVTGANRGIGKVIVETLLARGAGKVYAAVRKPESAGTLVEAHGDRVVPIEVDLVRPETIAAAAKTANDVQVVINNAGILKRADPFSPDAVAALNEEITVNVAGLMHMARTFAPVLKANGGGAFVQLNSVASLRSFPDFATYCASKAAAYSITQALQDRLRPEGTLVVSVHPGPIATDMANNAGLGDIAEPPSLVADAIVEALAADRFHVFPDSMAKQMFEAYRRFAEEVVEAEASEG